MALDDLLLSQFTKIELLHGELDLTVEHAEQQEIEKNMPIEEIWLSEFDEILAGILTGLIHAFDNGIMHRDLKPGNILISISEEDKVIPLLIDFGIATLSENLGSNQATVGDTRTKLYSPEITDEEKEFPGARDVYSWGVIAIECLSKEQIRTYTDLIRIFEDEIEPNFPQSIVKILGDCISLRAKNRPKDVKHLLKILQAANKKLRL
jgi:serine/threonine protein kinase